MSCSPTRMPASVVELVDLTAGEAEQYDEIAQQISRLAVFTNGDDAEGSDDPRCLGKSSRIFASTIPSIPKFSSGCI
ncbi:MAG: hypothetical protein JWO13_355 [Acidobacteriales bacterium]|nr:hypothetical protein [Terriglobales bacterium]